MGWAHPSAGGARVETQKTSSEVRSGEGCQRPLLSRLGDLGSVMSSPSGVKGETSVEQAFSAYSRPQKTSRIMKNVIFAKCKCLRLYTGRE